MADRSVDVLLVGGGVASVSCARALREGGLHGSILLVGREADAPYERPPCSKELLRGEVGRDALALELPAGVEVLTRTSVLKLDTGSRIARLSTKQEVAYGQALLATGANVRRLPVEGAQLEGIHYLRALANADAIRRDAQAVVASARASASGGDPPASRGDPPEAVVVGGSYLGTELAASLTLLGLRVTVVMQERLPLQRHYGATAGAWFADLLAARGVRFAGETALEAFVGEGGGDADDDARVTGVRISGGDVLPASLVVIAAGAVPDVMLAKASGLEIGPTGGVRCDAMLRCAGADDLWAAGDMCEWESSLHGGPARVEHWDVAAAHGRTAAAGMLGEPRPHEEIPYFWSDLADWATSEYVGATPEGWDDETVRGSPVDGAFSVWFRRGGRVLAALSVGRAGDLEHARRLIAARTPVDAAALADPSIDLATL